jgi:precorrin-3B methylase
MPDTLDQSGFDPEKNVVGEDAIAELRDRVIRVASVVTGDTQVARLRPMVLLMIAAAAVALAPIRVRVPGVLALILAAADVARRR